MFCKSCGAEMQEGGQFCPNCGADQGVIQGPEPIATAQKENKKSLLIIALIIGITAVLLIWLVNRLTEPDYVGMIKNSTLNEYDYGKKIGPALSNWFDGDVAWDSYEEYDTVYVTATGDCPYYTEEYNSRQIFCFMIVDEESMEFFEDEPEAE